MHIHTTVIMSRVYIHQTHLPTTTIIDIPHLRLMPIRYAPIYDAYMYVVPYHRQLDAIRTSHVRVHLLLRFNYVKVHLLLHFSYDSI